MKKWIGRALFAVGCIVFVTVVAVLAYANLTGMEMG